MEPVVTKISETLTLTRYPETHLMALNAEDLRHAAMILEYAAQMLSLAPGATGPADVRRIALQFVAAANYADALKDADRAESARHDAEVDAAQEAAERNAAAHE